MTRRKILVMGGVALVAGAAVVSAAIFNRKDVLEGSGTIEARNIRVGSKVGGRIAEVRAREGDVVEAGQVLITFDDKELKANLDQARANLEKMERGFRQEEIAEARAVLAQARADYEQRKNGFRREDIDAARAELERARADEVRAGRAFHRADDLANQEIFSRQQRDDAEAAWKMAVALRQSAEQKLAELERGYRAEEVASSEARYLQAQAVLEKMVRGSRREDVEMARAQYAYEEARFRERQVTAPAAAVVEVLDVRPGDLLAPNTPVVTLLERDQIYLRIYIPETQVGQVKLGQEGAVRADSFPKEVFRGIVEQINQQGEFLPRNVQTKEERVHQVFGVKLRIENRSGRLRPGMAADARLKMGSN